MEVERGSLVQPQRSVPSERPSSVHWTTDELCKLRPTSYQIPRPKVGGMEWVQTRGRFGFYMSVSRRGGPGEFKLPAQNLAGRQRPTLSVATFEPPPPNSGGSSGRSASGSQTPSPVFDEPDYSDPENGDDDVVVDDSMKHQVVHHHHRRPQHTAFVEYKTSAAAARNNEKF